MSLARFGFLHSSEGQSPRAVGNNLRLTTPRSTKLRRPWRLALWHPKLRAQPRSQLFRWHQQLCKRVQIPAVSNPVTVTAEARASLLSRRVLPVCAAAARLCARSAKT